MTELHENRDELVPLLRALLLSKKRAPLGQVIDFNSHVMVEWLEDMYYKELSYTTRKTYHKTRADVYMECRNMLMLLSGNEDRQFD